MVLEKLTIEVNMKKELLLHLIEVKKVRKLTHETEGKIRATVGWN